MTADFAIFAASQLLFFSHFLAAKIYSLKYRVSDHLSGKLKNVRELYKAVRENRKSLGIVMENYCCSSVAVPGCSRILIMFSHMFNEFDSPVSSGESKPECHSGISPCTLKLSFGSLNICSTKSTLITFPGRGKLPPPCLCLRAPMAFGFCRLSNAGT